MVSDKSFFNQNSFHDPKRNLGFGIGLRRPHFDEIFTHHQGVDFLEFVSDNYMNCNDRDREVLEKAGRLFPIVLHGVSLSIGSPDPLNKEYLQNLEKLIEMTNAVVFSDHLSYSSAFGVEYHDLIPLPFTKEVVDHIVPRVKQVQKIANIPFLLENPSYYVEMPGAEMTEVEFVLEILEKSDCGLLLDINNVYVNAQNHGYDPFEYVDAMPPERVYQYHMAGHYEGEHCIIDTHGSNIKDEVYRLYEHSIRHTGPVSTIVEWDNEIPPLDELLGENRKVRRTSKAALRERKRASA